MAKMSKEVIDLFQDPGVPKMVATVSKHGEFNVTPETRMTAIDDETLAIAHHYGPATRTFRNLAETKDIAIRAMKLPVARPSTTYQVKGTFQKYLTSGPVFDKLAREFKQVIGVTISGVSTVKVDAIYSQTPETKPNCSINMKAVSTGSRKAISCFSNEGCEWVRYAIAP